MVNPFKHPEARKAFWKRVLKYKALIPFKTSDGFPLLAGVTHYRKEVPQTYWDPGATREFEYDLLTLKGRPVPNFILQKFLMNEEKHDQEILELYLNPD